MIDKTTDRPKALLRLDPRLRCMIVFMLSPVTFLVNTPITSGLFTAGLAILMFLSGIYKKTIAILIFYCFLLFIEHLTHYIGNVTLLVAATTVNFFFLKFTAIFMLGSFLIKTTTVTEIICALETLKIPNQITIPFAVAVRFIPSIQEDFTALKASLRVRNISISLWSFLRRPIQTVEYMLVPILMRAYKISDELAASAMIRGIDSANKKTLLYTLKFGIQDFITSFIIIAAVCALLYYQHIYM